MTSLGWLTARPIAHRGLHDKDRGIIENSPSAVAAAIAGQYAIEVDLQLSADGEAMVFHDDDLFRLTEQRGPIAGLSSAELAQIPYKGSNDRIITLDQLCDLVAERATMVIELKSKFDGDSRIAKRAVEVLRAYKGPAALMSFDPALVEAVRNMAPTMTRGIVAERYYDHPEWKFLTAMRKRYLAFLLHAPQTKPQFVAYKVSDLPSPGPSIGRALVELPLLTWTVRTDADLRRAKRYADQIIFEGFRA
jgi:glycerophosphoryl diester phosphodiesterase